MKNKNVAIKTPTKQNSQVRVGVLFGGRSTEHEISLRSALFVLKSLPQKYNIIPIGISKAGTFHTLIGEFKAQDFRNYSIEDLNDIVAGKVPKKSSNCENKPSIIYPIPLSTLTSLKNLTSSYQNLNNQIDCFFPVLHGTNGEDGRLQGLFEMAEVAYVGCDRVSSVVGMDKDLQKRLVKDAGIPTTDYISILHANYINNPNHVYHQIESIIGFPCCIKPNSLGSAIGVHKVRNRDELTHALSDAFQYDSKVLAEAWVIGTEVECSFLGDASNPRISSPGEISTNDYYSYEEKYSDQSTSQLYIPARLEDNRVEILKQKAQKIAKALDLKGFSRIDFWNVKNQNKFLFNEVNTIPGLTSISMFPKLLEHDGISAQEWLEELIQNAMQYK